MVYTAAGKYQAVNLYPGDYEVTVARRGFAADPQKIKVQAGAAVKADFVLKDADPAPKAGVQWPVDRGRLSRPRHHHRQGRRVLHRLREGLSARARPASPRTGLHGVSRREFLRGAGLGSLGLGRPHHQDEQAQRRHGYIGPAGPAVAEGPPAPARLSRDQHGAEREEARACDHDRHAARRGGVGQGHVRRIRHAQGQRAERAADRTEPVFRQRRQRLDDRPRHAECDRQARSAHGEMGAFRAARARRPARHHGRFQGHDLVGRDRRLQVRPPRSQDREDGPLPDRSARLPQGPRP